MSYSPTNECERQKRTHTKVRTGCSTCKQRHVKCDETKPTCKRCSTGNRRCIYAVPRTWVFERQRETLHLIQPQSASIGSPDEQRAFSFFKENTAAQIAGNHDIAQRFWRQFVPQSANNDPLIFKLAVAMGARHEATMYGTPNSSDLAGKSHTTVITTMSRHLTQMRVDQLLVCCSMLMGHANLCENVPISAPVHLNFGLKILREQSHSGQVMADDSMGAFVMAMFTELELAVTLFTVAAVEADIIAPRPFYLPRLPEYFDDLHQAKEALDDLLGSLLYIMTEYRSSPTELKVRSAEVDDLLASWYGKVLQYSLRVAPTCPALHLKARKMLFQYKLFGMCRGAAAMDDIFTGVARAHIRSVDFTQPHVTSVLCKLRADDVDNSRRPLCQLPSRKDPGDDLDIWPSGQTVGHDGPNQIVRIVLGG